MNIIKYVHVMDNTVEGGCEQHPLDLGTASDELGEWCRWRKGCNKHCILFDSTSTRIEFYLRVMEIEPYGNG